MVRRQVGGRSDTPTLSAVDAQAHVRVENKRFAELSFVSFVQIHKMSRAESEPFSASKLRENKGENCSLLNGSLYLLIRTNREGAWRNYGNYQRVIKGNAIVR